MKDGQKPLLEAKNDEEMLSTAEEFVSMSGMALQLSTTRIVRMLLTIIDAAFLGHLGTKQLAGVSLSGMWQGVPSTFVQFCLQAITTLSSQARGAGNKKLVGDWLQTSFLVGMIGALPVMAIFWNVHYLVAMTMKDEETIEYAKTFSRTMMWSLIPQYLYVSMTSYFATIGVVMPATVCTCITVFCNIAFNYAFIYGWGPIEAQGFVGSPRATVTSSWIQLILFVLYTVVIKQAHKDYWGGWNKEAFSWGRVRTFLALGVPTGLSSVVDWMSGAIVGSFSGWAGVEVAAGQNVLNGLFSITYSFVSGFSTATQIRLARYLGEGKPAAAQRILRIGSATLLCGGVIVCGIVSIWHQSVWKIWTTDPALVAKCDSALFAFMAGIIMAYVRFTLTTVCSSLGPKEAHINLIANNIASWVIYVPLAYVLPIYYNMGISGFWWSDFFGEAFKVMCLAYAVKNVDWVQASIDARRKAEAAQENTKECETLEKQAFASLGAYTTPTGKVGDANLAAHSPNLLTRNAAEMYNSSVGKTEAAYVRSPAGPYQEL